MKYDKLHESKELILLSRSLQEAAERGEQPQHQISTSVIYPHVSLACRSADQTDNPLSREAKNLFLEYLNYETKSALSSAF